VTLRPLALLPLTAVGFAACVHAPPVVVPGPTTSDAAVSLHGHALALHLSLPAGPPPESPGRGRQAPVLLVYATGDAGWWGKDRDIFSHIKRWGYPAVGFSAREYVHHLRQDAVRPSEIASDYAAIIQVAQARLGLPATTRAVLVGKSRGAGLAVAAAGRYPQNPGLAGLLAVGLTREEEYVHHRLSGSGSHQLVMLQTYSYLCTLGNMPVAVIQSTHDGYVPAAEARRLLGPDTSLRELVAIDSRDHNFGGALDELYTQMERSLEWIVVR
jgi:Bacterial virulence protein (VirJ)